MDYVVYVLDKEGRPMMPTRRFGKVRRMLKAGLAKPVTTKPFTIQLLYEPKTHIVDELTLGIDPGRTNIGITVVKSTGEAVYSATCKTRNKDVPKRMSERRQHRQASRRGERQVRKRRAKQQGTLRKKPLERKLPGYEDGMMKPKGIINAEAKFNNQKRPAGWLTPTAKQLLQTHINLVNLICKILPVNKIVIEINKFAFMALDHPNIRKWQYQKGPLYGTDGLHAAVSEQQNETCLLCRKNPIEEYHHLVPRSENGSNTIENIAGLCKPCHTSVHTDESMKEKLERKKAGCNKKYGALSVLNQIIPSLFQELSSLFPNMVYATNGYSTKAFQDANDIPKDHDLDAYCIACSILDQQTVYETSLESHFIKQFRNHDRSVIHHQTERSYYLDKKKIATNRKPRTEQKGNSLIDWFQKTAEQFGTKQAKRLLSKLTVKSSRRSYNDLNRILPGAVFYYCGRRYVMAGQHCHGNYLRAYGKGTKDFNRKQCSIYPANGLVYIN